MLLSVGGSFSFLPPPFCAAKRILIATMPDHESADPQGSDAASDTSTFYHGHEAFATFQLRVHALAQTLWPGTPADGVLVEQLKGGSFNRIVGLSRRTNEDGVDRYILRIPREEDARLDRDVAALMFLHSNTDIPVPRVITYDESADNALSLPYMLQHRVPGENAYTCFGRLSHEQKCSLARELGSILRYMLQMQSSQAGYLVLRPDSKEELAIIPLRNEGRDSPPSLAPYTNGPAALSAFDLIKSLLEAEREWELAVVGVGLKSDLLSEFLEMLSELESEGWLSGMMPNSLVHLDLAPRNILVDTNQSKPGQPVISAILDWDSAAFAPSFLGCAPPSWIWTWDDEEEEDDERTANDVPPTVEAQQLKQVFEDDAGPDYLRLAYPPQYRLLRKLTRFALDSSMSNEDIRDAEAMLSEWATLRMQGQEEPGALLSSQSCPIFTRNEVQNESFFRSKASTT